MRCVYNVWLYHKAKTRPCALVNRGVGGSYGTDGMLLCFHLLRAGLDKFCLYAALIL